MKFKLAITLVELRLRVKPRIQVPDESLSKPPHLAAVLSLLIELYINIEF